MFVIIEGTCDILKNKLSRDGTSEQVKLATISDNQVVGENAIKDLQAKPRGASVIVTSEMC